ncbi:MAG: hypothetical protein RL653_1025, partial [Pseudomonadota bacterium]
LQDADWLAMASGKADPQKLFMSGKLKITGKVMASQKLEFLTKLDRSAVPVAAAGPASASAPAPAAATAAPATPKFIERLQQELGGGTLGREAGGTLLVKVKDPDAAIFVDFQQRSVKAGEGTAQATLTLSDEALGKLVRGEQSLESLYQHGELRVDGDVLAARRLSAIKFN